jgi:hypothetical protein
MEEARFITIIFGCSGKFDTIQTFYASCTKKSVIKELREIHSVCQMMISGDDPHHLQDKSRHKASGS